MPPRPTPIHRALPAPARRHSLRRWWLGGPALATVLLTAGPGWAGNVTADSVWDRNDARQRALQQVPRGATVTDTRCQDLEVGMDNTRYRCSVTFTDPPPAPSPAPTAPATSP